MSGQVRKNHTVPALAQLRTIRHLWTKGNWRASYSETHDGRLLTQITTSGRSFPAPTRSTAPFPMAEGGV